MALSLARHTVSLAGRTLLAAALSAACSTTPGLALSATPVTIGGDGESPITVTARVTRGGGPVDGVSVHFTATLGAFKDAPGLPGVLDVISADGVATAQLIVPRRGRGQIDFTASASLDDQAVNATSNVKLTPAGGLASSIDFTCGASNVGGFVTGRTEAIRVLCSAKAFDALHHEIPKASIETMAEAGRLEWETDDTGKQQLIYTIDPGAPPPLDVDPFDTNGQPRTCPSACAADPAACDAEPCWVEGTVTHNPRDGLATLVVAVPAVAGHDDPDFPGEPYVDVDDDNVRSATETQYIDVNGNGKHDKGGTGELQDPRMVWKVVRIVWSGSADATNTAHGSKMLGTVAAANVSGVKLRIHDRNFNKLAANGAAGTDKAAFSGVCVPSDATIDVPADAPLEQDKAGILIGTDGKISGPQFPTTYRQGTEYPLGGMAATFGTGHPVCTVTAQLSRTFSPATDAGGGTSSDSETVSGAFTF